MSDAMYPNCSMCSEDLIPDDGELCGACARAVSETAKEMIAAAEERGRRAGYAEAVREAGNLAVVYGKGEWSDTLVKLIRALAPRDSGKEG